MWAFACLLVIGSLYRIGKYSKKLVFPSEFKLIVLFPALVTFSELLSGFEFTTSAVFTLLSLWILTLFLLALFQYELEQHAINNIFLIIVFSGLLEGLVGVIQSHYYNPGFHFIPGLEKVSPPPYGFFQQINNQVTYQVTCLMILFFLLGNGYHLKRGYLVRVLTLIFAFLAAYIVSRSGSRVGIITLLVSLPLILYGQWPMLKKNKTALSFVFLMMLLGVISGSNGFERVGQKLEFTEHSYSSSARLGILKVSWELFKEHPIIGHGLGSFEPNWQYEKGRYLQSHPNASLIESYVSHPHNELVLWAIESGLIGFAGLVSLLLGVLLSLRHLGRRQIATYLALLLPIGLHTQVELPYYTSAIHLFTSGFLIYLVMRKRNCSVIPVSNKVTKVAPILSLTLLVLSLKFFSHVVLANREMGFTQTPWNLPIARTSIYYSELAKGIENKSKLIEALSKGNQQEVFDFISWGTKALEIEPSLQLFLLLSSAYSAIGDKEGLCKTAQKGASIYPNDTQLKTAIKHCSPL